MYIDLSASLGWATSSFVVFHLHASVPVSCLSYYSIVFLNNYSSCFHQFKGYRCKLSYLRFKSDGRYKFIQLLCMYNTVEEPDPHHLAPIHVFDLLFFSFAFDPKDYPANCKKKNKYYPNDLITYIYISLFILFSKF
jgi:hypothetical protein